MSQDWSAFAVQVLDFLKEILPGLLAAFIGGYSIGKSKYSSVKKQLLNSEMKLKYRENEDAVQEEYAGLSDADTIKRAVERFGRGTKDE